MHIFYPACTQDGEGGGWGQRGYHPLPPLKARSKSWFKRGVFLGDKRVFKLKFSMQRCKIRFEGARHKEDQFFVRTLLPKSELF